MDQYVIEFNYSMLYYDMLDLITLIEKSNDENLIAYVDSLKEIVDNET